MDGKIKLDILGIKKKKVIEIQRQKLLSAEHSQEKKSRLEVCIKESTRTRKQRVKNYFKQRNIERVQHISN